MQRVVGHAAAKIAFRRLPGFWLRFFSVICLLLLLSFQALSAQDSNQEVLTNEGVVELVKAKVGDSVILSMIQTLPTKFSLSKDAVIKLKQSGVSDKVLAAMVARGSSANPAGGSALTAEKHQPLSAAERKASSETVGTWEVRDKKDPMTDQEFFEAHLLVTDDARERIDVTATCSSSAGGTFPGVQAFFDQMKGLGAPMKGSGQAAPALPPSEDMRFDIAYHPKAGQSLARVTTPMTGKVERAPELFGSPMGDDKVTLQGGASCVHVSMRLGDMYYGSVKAGGCGDSNTLALMFSSSDPKASDFVGSKNINNGMLGSLMNMYVQGSINADRGHDATLNDVRKADKFLVGLPIKDGSTTVVPLATTEPSFRKFLARCDADFAKLAPPPAAPAPPKPRPTLVPAGVTVTGWTKAMLSPPKFAGSAGQFATAFPGFLQQAAAAAGFDAKAFEKESAFVVDSIRTCAQITPAMAAQATSPMPGHRVVTRTLGQQYVVCQAGGGTEANAQYPDTRIAMQLDSGGGENYKLGKGFTVFVFFVKTGQGSYPIVSATISAMSSANPTGAHLSMPFPRPACQDCPYPRL